MKTPTFKLAFAILLLSMSACSTATLNFDSTPKKAQIYAVPLGGNPKLIGETPLTIKGPDLATQYQGSGPFFLEFRKEGYVSSRTVVTDLSAIDLTVSVNLTPTNGLEDKDKLNSVISRLFEAQRLGRAGRYDDALTKLKELETEAPQLAAIYELEGGIYFLQRKYNDSLDAYSSAVRKDPNAVEALRMRDKIVKMNGANESGGKKP